MEDPARVVRLFVAGKAFEDPEDCQERGNTRINAWIAVFIVFGDVQGFVDCMDNFGSSEVNFIIIFYCGANHWRRR